MTAPTVLVVDDDKLTRWSVSRILGRAGYRVREAASAEEGLHAIAEQRPEAVLLDVVLPDLDGFAVLRAIRQDYPGLPVILMTAHASRETLRAAMEFGAQGHLAKPCNPAELHAALSDVIRPCPPPPPVLG
jgi:two-component system, OmpR family, phosphate regulon response regulator OmpR